jgi:predicted TIM-barrel fold metal-dependent hydrolase
VEGTLAEIAYCFDELGVDGVMMFSNHQGLRPADRRLAPVLEELDRRAAVVLLHPTTCPGHEELSSGRPQPMIEFLFETARTVVDYILSGAADRFPGIRLIVPHLGGVLPLVVERVQAFLSLGDGPGDGPGGEAAVGRALGRFHYDLAGMPSEQQIAALAAVARPERLLYGSDYAWTRRGLALKLLADLDATMPAVDRHWRALTTRNAEQLFSSAARQTSR